ncbi:MAG: hypothetical protein QX198_15425, partial [Methylococcaceae bacterium]
MAVIVASSILLTAIPASVLVYSYAQNKILHTETTKLLRFTNDQTEHAAQQFMESKPKLENLVRLLQNELAKPVNVHELKEFHQLMALSSDGV